MGKGTPMGGLGRRLPHKSHARTLCQGLTGGSSSSSSVPSAAASPKGVGRAAIVAEDGVEQERNSHAVPEGRQMRSKQRDETQAPNQDNAAKASPSSMPVSVLDDDEETWKG